MAWRAKAGWWLRRYGVAEIAGTFGAVLCSLLVRALTGNDVAAAYGGVVGENLGYYGVIVSREIAADARAAAAASRHYGPRAALRTAGNLLSEFGVAELLDSTALRPLAMGLGVRYFGSEVGIVVGKLVADVTFYIPVIMAYELRQYLGRPARRPAADD